MAAFQIVVQAMKCLNIKTADETVMWWAPNDLLENRKKLNLPGKWILKAFYVHL